MPTNANVMWADFQLVIEQIENGATALRITLAHKL